MELKKLLAEVVNGKYRIKNYTCNGKCSKCGDCCGSILPIDQEDLDKITEYVIENKIFPKKQILVMEQKLKCPYYNGKKEKGCSIYTARPKICKIFKCDEKPNYEQYLTLKNAIPVNMWELALDIEKEMIRNESDKKTRKTAH